MLCIVAYDIPEDGTRSLIASELKNWGHRVQYSVFECDLDDQRITELTKRLQALISARDSVRIYRLCEMCRTRGENMGGKSFLRDEAYYQV
jgi:CRISPR-associated protein Cas2